MKGDCHVPVSQSTVGLRLILSALKLYFTVLAPPPNMDTVMLEMMDLVSYTGSFDDPETDVLYVYLNTGTVTVG